MTVAWSAIEPSLSVLALVVSVGLAAVVWATGPRRRANRLLALLLALTGASTFLFGPWTLGPVEPAVLVFNGASTALVPVVYVLLLAETLETPLVRPFRRRPVQAAVAALAVASAIPFFAATVGAVRAGPPLDVDAVYEALAPALALQALVLAFALAASVSAWRRAPAGSATRSRARHFTLAFGVRDVVVALAILAPAEFAGAAALWPLALVLSVPLLAYGILKSQLFDIDLRLKDGVRRGTILAVLLVAFGGLAIVVERASTRALGVAAGGVGVLLLLAAFVPLERFAALVADRAFPRVRADEDYLGRRKLEVYRAALEDAMARDPHAVDADRVLADLRDALGVTREQHAILALALAPRLGPASAVPAPFEIVGELGRGGFGRALLARDRHLDRHVVLKQPLGLGAAGPAGRDLFLREARLAAQIQHPNVVAVHQVIPDRDPPIIVLEHVDGESLADRLAREGALPPREVVRLGLDVLAGLDRIHRAGIVHRDLKPANILIARDGTCKITDFGVAHAPADGAAARALTAVGHHPGSPAYMSPEQARGRPIDARSDLYSLGIVLHEALTGRLPASGGVTLAAPVLPAAAAAIAPAGPLAGVLQRALDADPARRYADASEMAAALEAASPGASRFEPARG